MDDVVAEDPLAIRPGDRVAQLRISVGLRPGITKKKAISHFRKVLFKSMLQYWWQDPLIMEQTLKVESHEPEMMKETLKVHREYE